MLYIEFDCFIQSIPSRMTKTAVNRILINFVLNYLNVFDILFQLLKITFYSRKHI